MACRPARIGRIRLSAVCSLLPLCFFFIALPAVAEATVSITLKLDRNETTLADSIRMIVGVSGTRDSDAEPLLKGLDAFHVSRGGISSRVQIINGQVSGGVEYTYFIQAKKVGTFQIGPAEMTIDGKTIRSNTASLTIAEQRQSSGIDRGPLFLTASMSSDEAYLEEQILYTLKLYLLANVKDISLELPKKEGITFKQLADALQYQSVYDGRNYRVYEIRYALIPSREGIHAIGPSRVNLTVLERRSRSRRSLFDDPFFSFATGRPTTLTSETLELEVLPLPEKDRPADFSGLVGTFRLESRIEPAELKAGESATFTVLLTGRGNVNRIPDLKLPHMDNTKVYADQPVLEVKADNDGLGGSKTMKWAVVPEEEGVFNIPPLAVSFFDTSSGKYRVIRTSSHTLSVAPGKEEELLTSVQPGSGMSPGSASKQEVRELGRDILPVHTSIKDFESGFLARSAGSLLWSLLVAPFLAWGAAFCRIRFRKDSAKASVLAKTKKAGSVLIKKCRHGDLSAADLAEAIRDYLNDRFTLSHGSLTPQEAFEILTSRGVRPQAAQRLDGILQRLEDDIYSGGANDACDMEDGIPNIIKEIEKDIG